MIKYNFLLLLATLFFLHSATAQHIAASKTYALVIGISGYQNTTIPKLDYADKDASLFAQWLQSKAGGSVPGYQVKLLANENATISAVYSALDWLKETTTAGDTVYIYFSGHGDIETKDSISQGYLLAWNSPANNYRNNAISVADLNNTANTITTSNKANVILITDACHSGKMAGDFYKGRELTASNLKLVLNNQVRLASCRANEKAAEGPYWGGGRGVFSYYMLRGLNGEAGTNGMVKLRDLQTFIDSSFAADKYLILDNHKQHPVMDGSPVFPLAAIDTTALQALRNIAGENSLTIPAASAGLQSLKTVGRQPIDYFFEIAQGSTLDSVLHFEKYTTMMPDDVPLQIVTDYITYLDKLKTTVDSLDVADSLYEAAIKLKEKNTDNSNAAILESLSLFRDSLFTTIETVRQLRSNYHDQYYLIAKDSLRIFQKQLEANKYIRNRFVENFVQLTHQKAQDMINAYLTGDIAELERRQYYYAGNRKYQNFLPVINTAIHLAPANNYLHNILKINEAYIAGLIYRLEITTHQNKPDNLLTAAFAQQQKALKLEPYAAYIHNELGNLYFQKRNFDSAAYHFNFALLLSPTWAIPWSNKIRLNLALNNLTEAKEAIRMADSLQPGLAFVNINAGLVMEKDRDWLAAEGYFLNAIAQNNVHYLPFERLGKIYIATGEYAKADSFLYEAKKRKDDFVVNESVFDFGIELGGRETGLGTGKYWNDCDAGKDSTEPGWASLTQLANSLSKSFFATTADDSNKKLLQQLLEKMPLVPLAQHYLGKIYFNAGNWQQAEKALQKAKLNFRPDPELREAFKQLLTDSLAAQYTTDPKSDKGILITGVQFTEIKKDMLQFADSSCLLVRLLNFSYDVVEDHYLLANIYEKQGFIDDAIKEYKTIASLENLRQMEQAVLKGYEQYYNPTKDGASFTGSEEDDQHLELSHSELVSKYNNPIRMGGSLKAAAICEAQERYVQAEEMLLQQVAMNRQAGYARQEEMNKGNFGPTGRFPLNYYWLDVNRDLEAATYNFYTRMLQKFPRDAYWYKQAGMFLYERLVLTYSQIPHAERKTFYNYQLDYAYPFEGSLEPPNDGYDYDSIYRRLQVTSSLPGTGELLVTDLHTYDPVKNAQSWLQHAIRFSGEENPDPVIQEANAELLMWMGNNDKAITLYESLVSVQPKNASLRNKLLDLYVITKKLPEAAAQLVFLKTNGQARRHQLLQLAAYKIRSKDHAAAVMLLNGFKPENEAEKNLKSGLLAKQYLLAGQPKQALQYISKITPPEPIGEFEYAPEKEEQARQYFLTAYTKARIEAMTGNTKNALLELKDLLDAGFSYKYVLDEDSAWDKSRKLKQWQTLMNANEWKNIYEEEGYGNYQMNTGTVGYRIPALERKWSWGN